MSPELLSSRSRAEGRLDGDRYEHLLAVDPVLRSIARVTGCPDPFVWFARGGAALTNFAAMALQAAALLWASLPSEPYR